LGIETRRSWSSTGEAQQFVAFPLGIETLWHRR